MRIISLLTILLYVMLTGCSNSKNPAGPFYKEEKGKTANGYFFITSPAANSRVNLDSLLNILWIASNKVVDSSAVRITLLKDSACLRTITASTSNNGAYKYILSRLGSGTSYQVKISTSDTTQFDISGFFELYSNYSGTLSMSYPSAGSVLMLESSDTLRWNYTDFPGPRIRLDLYCDTAFVFTITESMAMSLKTYPWSSVSSPLGTNTRYRIKLTSESDESISCYSDCFTIKSIYNGGYVLKDPIASTVWTSGDTGVILWDTTGFPGPLVNIKLFKHDTLIGSVASNIANTERYDWLIGKNMTTGTDYRIRIESAKDAGLYAVSSNFTITGIDIDKYEPDNRRTSLHETVIDSLENRSLTLNDTDCVQFSADSGSQYLILSNVSTGLKIGWKFYFGSEITPVDSGVSPPDGKMCFLWNCKKSGKYNGVIVPQDSISAGLYSFRICKFDPLKIAAFTSPKIMSEVNAGTKVTVSWIPDTLVFGQSVKLYLFRGSDTIESLSQAVLPNSGSFEWSIPSGIMSGSDYSLHIVNETDRRIYGKGPVFSIVGMPPDQFENDNKRSTASKISSGVIQQHSISLNDTDWVSFSAKSGTSYVFMMQCSDSFSASVSLFRDSLAQVLLTGAADSAGQYSTVWKCQYGTDYCIRITASVNKTFGNYNLRVIEFDSLNSIKFTSPHSSMTFLRGSQTTISWLADSIITTDTFSISLYRGNLFHSILVSRLPAGTASFAWSIADSLSSADNYQIRITSLANPILYGYSSKFIISEMAPDVYEFDGTPALASQAILDSMQNHNIIFNDTDIIKFTADSAIKYVFNVNGVNQFRISGSIFLEQAAAAFHTISSDLNGRSTTVWSCPKSGVYYCRLTGLSINTSGAYSFKISKFDPERIVTFIAPAAGTSWAADSVYNISFDSEGNCFDGTNSVYLYRESDSLLQIAQSAVKNGNLTWKIPLSLTPGTDYRIRVVNTANPLCYGISQRFTIKGLPEDQYEPDNSWSQARQYTYDINELHSITSNDTDYIKFPVDSGAIYEIRIKGTNSFRTYAAIHYENIWSNNELSIPGNTDVANVLWNSNKSTNAYIKMYLSRFSTNPVGYYSIHVSKFDPLKSITFISPSAETIVNEGNSLNVEWIPESDFLGSTVSVQLLKAGFEVLSSPVQCSFKSGKVSIWIPKNILVTGNDYQIKIADDDYYGYSPFFTITGTSSVADDYEIDNTAESAKSIALGEMQEHNLFNNDKDWIVFPITEGEQYVLKGNINANTNFKVHQGSPSSIDKDFSESYRFRKLITARTTGSCFIEVSSPLSPQQYQTYSFSVLHLDSDGVLKITSPSEGAVLTSGQNNILSWTCDTAVYGSNFNAYIYKDNTVCTRILFVNTGNHTWDANGALSGENYQVKIVSSLDSSLYAYSPVFTIKGIDADIYEVDNTPDKATEIITGTVQQHNLTINDTDWVKFNASSGTEYMFMCFKEGGTRINFSLFDSENALHPNSTILVEEGQYSHDTTIFSWICKTSGTYYLKCYPVELRSSRTGYSLQMIQTDTAQNIEISEPAAGAVYTAGSAHNIIWTPKTELFGPLVQIRLLKGDTIVTIAEYIPNTGSYSLIIPPYCENGSDYRILISRHETHLNRSFYSSNFSVIGGGVDPDQYEPDNSKENASVMAIDEMSGHTIFSDDTDWVKFQADSGFTYVFTDSLICDPLEKIIFYENPNSGYRSELITGKNTNEWSCYSSGFYYARITFSSSGVLLKKTGRYYLRISKK